MREAHFRLLSADLPAVEGGEKMGIFLFHFFLKTAIELSQAGCYGSDWNVVTWGVICSNTQQENKAVRPANCYFNVYPQLKHIWDILHVMQCIKKMVSIKNQI